MFNEFAPVCCPTGLPGVAEDLYSDKTLLFAHVRMTASALALVSSCIFDSKSPRSGINTRVSISTLPFITHAHQAMTQLTNALRSILSLIYLLDISH